MLISTFIAYLAALIIIVVWSARRSKTKNDFVLGGKKISGFSLALSERATGESAWLLLGLTGIAYTEGISAIWVAIGCVSGIIFLWTFMAEPLRSLTAKTGSLTVPGLFFRSFPGSERTMGTLSSSIVVFFFMLYIAAQFSGSGKIFHDTFKIDPFWGMVIGSGIVTVYTVLGGFITVVATDVFQAILMVITCVVLPVVALLVAASQIIEIAASLAEQGNQAMASMHQTDGLTGSLLVLNGLSWAFGYTGQPQLLNRMMAMKDKQSITQSRWLAISWTFLAYGGAFITGIIGFHLAKAGLLGNGLASVTADAEKIMPVMAVTLLHPLLAGILLSGAVSAMMSTASSQLIVVSSSITEDLYMTTVKKKLSEKRSLFLNRILTLFVGIAAFAMAILFSKIFYQNYN